MSARSFAMLRMSTTFLSALSWRFCIASCSLASFFVGDVIFGAWDFALALGVDGGRLALLFRLQPSFAGLALASFLAPLPAPPGIALALDLGLCLAFFFFLPLELLAGLALPPFFFFCSDPLPLPQGSGWQAPNPTCGALAPAPGWWALGWKAPNPTCGALALAPGWWAPGWKAPNPTCGALAVAPGCRAPAWAT